MTTIGKTIILNENEDMYIALSKEQVEKAENILQINSITDKIKILKVRHIPNIIFK